MTDVWALTEDALVSNVNCKCCCDVFVCSSALYTGRPINDRLHQRIYRSEDQIVQNSIFSFALVLRSQTKSDEDELIFKYSNTGEADSQEIQI